MKFWQTVLWPLSCLHSSLARFRRWLYRHGFLSVLQLPVPVISVGNLSMGGTGKTPFTELLIRLLLQRKKKVAVISRSYKARVHEPSEIIEVTSESAEQFGDESTMIKSHFPEVRVFVGKSKSQVASYFFANGKNKEIDVVIVDDAFQHLKLHRNLNIVLCDANEDAARVFPSGNFRESFSAMKDADLVVVTKLDSERPQKALRLIQEEAESQNIPTILSKSLQARISEEAKKFKQAVIFSGLAKNEDFVSRIRNQFPGSVATQFYPDHHRYSPADIQSLKKMGIEASSIWICSEKDWVKLQGLWPKELAIEVVGVQIEIVDGKETLNAALDSLFS